MSEDEKFGYAEKPATQIWRETPSDNNWVASQHQLCGYDIVQLSQKKSFADVLLLMFKGELPAEHESKLFNALMIAFINPGPRHPATRASMAAGIGKTNTPHILPIGMMVMGGEYNGAADVEKTMHFIASHQGESAIQLCQQTALSQKTTLSQQKEQQEVWRPYPGIGSTYGSRHLVASDLADAFASMAGVGPSFLWMQQMVNCIDDPTVGWLPVGLFSAIMLDLGIAPREGGSLYQLLSAPGILAHGLEQTHKPITAMPLPDDDKVIDTSAEVPVTPSPQDTKQDAKAFDGDYWRGKRERITSSVGKWVGGRYVTSHGLKLVGCDADDQGNDDQSAFTGNANLLGNISYMQMLVLNATGKRVEERVAKWLEGNFIGMSYPDPRIWCNQIGALAGTSNTSIVAATVSGILATDSRAYGGSQTNKIGMAFIQKAYKQYQQHGSFDEIVKDCKKNRKGNPVITGFARPMDRSDERIGPHEAMRKKLGFGIGKHLEFAFALGQYLEEKTGMGINIGGYSSAFLLDQDFTPDEIYRIKSLVCASGVMACAKDNQNSTTSSFLPMHCDDYDYTGQTDRKL